MCVCVSLSLSLSPSPKSNPETSSRPCAAFNRCASPRIYSSFARFASFSCLQLLHLSQRYHWEGKVEDDAEEMLVIKSHAGLLEQLTRTVQRVHPYDEPEVPPLPQPQRPQRPQHPTPAPPPQQPLPQPQ